ncbi:MAG: lytic transglycosylase domain-containing protein [Pseudomonadota bacterium]
MSVHPSADIPLHINTALQKASKLTGVDFQYLLNTAVRESSLNSAAKAQTSSATGLFQFIESTWLQTLKDEGGKFGLGQYAQHIVKTENGKYEVPNPQHRTAILDLRKDPDVSALMASAFTQKNADYLKGNINREPTSGELYIAHFLGARDAARLLNLKEESPEARADHVFSRAAEANKAIFYDNGQPRSISNVYDKLVKMHDTSFDPIASQLRPSIATEAYRVADSSGQNTQSQNTWNTQTSRTGQLIAPYLHQPNFNTSTTASNAEGRVGVWNSLIDLEEQIQNIEDEHLRNTILENYQRSKSLSRPGEQ